MPLRRNQRRERPVVENDDLQIPALNSPLQNTMPPRSKRERRRRIMENVKLNKPDASAQRDQITRCVLRAMAANARGEPFVYTSPRIFLILGGPFTLQRVQALVNERHEKTRSRSEKRRAMQPNLVARTSHSNTEDKLGPPGILTAEIARILIYKHAERRWVEREEVTGVRLPPGSVSDWWGFLSGRLHDRVLEWPLGMEYYVERLKGGVWLAGMNMEAFMVMRHFEIDEED